MYRKELYVWQDGKPVKATVRNYQQADFDSLIDIQRECFPPPFPSELWWNAEQLNSHLSYYPEGALCVEIGGQLVGSITGLLTSFDPSQPWHRWEEVTDHGYIRNHNPQGNSLYIVDISVKPAYRKMELGKVLMQAMYDRVIHDNLDRLLGGGRMPGYHKYSSHLSAEEYIEKVLAGELKDSVISFLLRCGRTPVCIIPDYLEDVESHNYALLMEWKNPFK